MDTLDEYTRRKRRDVLHNPHTYSQVYLQMFTYTPPPPIPTRYHEELSRLHAQYEQEAAQVVQLATDSVKYETPPPPPLAPQQMSDGTFYGLSDYFALRNTQRDALHAARVEESSRRDEVGVGRNVRQRAGINFRGTVSDLGGSVSIPVPMSLAAAAA